MEAAAIVLAAGAGTRMKSKKPKVAHEVLGKPLVRWVVDAAHDAGVTQVATVVGHAREQVIPLVEGDTQVVVQEVQNGTAGAVLACADAFADFDGSLSVLTGDCPLIKPETIARLAQVRDELNVEFSRLQLEQATWAESTLIDRTARERLGMVLPVADDIVVVRP